MQDIDIRKWITELIKAAIYIALTLAYVILSELTPVYKYIESLLSKKLLISLCTLLFLLLFSCIAALCCLLFELRKMARKKPLKLKYGVLWDDGKNPFCPACEKPLSGFGYRKNRASGSCNKCATVIYLDIDSMDFKNINDLKDSV